VPPSTVVTLIRLYPLYCTLYLCTLTLTRRHPQALVALSFTFVSEFFASISRCTLHWLQLRKLFLLLVSLRNLQTFCFILFVGSWPELPQHSILNTFVFSLVFCCIVASFSCTVFDPGLPSNPAHRFSIRYLSLTLYVHFILCVSYFDLQIPFLFNPCLALCVFVHSFALQWLPFFALLGTSAPQLFGLYLHFPNLPL
jgi:hypothetical protein